MATTVTGVLPAAPPAGRTLVVRGASRGFTVLLLGGVVQPLVSTVLPQLGYVWPAVVAVVAFAWSAWIASTPTAAMLVDAVSAAMGGYLLVTPVVVMLTGALDPAQIAGTSLTALVVAATVHRLRRLRDHRGGPR